MQYTVIKLTNEELKAALIAHFKLPAGSNLTYDIKWAAGGIEKYPVVSGAVIVTPSVIQRLNHV